MHLIAYMPHTINQIEQLMQKFFENSWDTRREKYLYRFFFNLGIFNLMTNNWKLARSDDQLFDFQNFVIYLQF